jgi:hypothetical protein
MFKGQAVQDEPNKMGLMGFPEVSADNYQFPLRNIPEK